MFNHPRKHRTLRRIQPVEMTPPGWMMHDLKQQSERNLNKSLSNIELIFVRNKNGGLLREAMCHIERLHLS